MGVNKLWKIIAPAVETRSLLNLATIEGFDCNNRGLRTLVVGVDISIRTSAIVKVLQGANIFHPGPGGDKLLLEKMFYQLCQFSRAPLTPVFAFDGPDRPPIKRGIRVMNHAAPVIQHLKTMIRAFGFHVHDAPGEAEAELAQLNRNDDIDAIITEDSDAFVFGATCVIRTLGPSVHDSSVIFTSQSIENSVSLDEGGLFLCALILGGDYGPGLKGAGTTVAHALAAEGFGGALAAILRSSTGVERRQRLAIWRNQLSQELKTNSSGRLGKRQTQLADNIPDSFPDVQVAELYLNPWTSRSAGFTGAMPNPQSWQPQEPDISQLSTFCSVRFGWNGANLLAKLNSNLWPGVAFRLISSHLVLYNPSSKEFRTPSKDARIVKAFPQPQHHPVFEDLDSLNIYRVRVCTDSFIHEASLDGVQKPAGGVKLVSIPRTVLAVAMRDTSSPSTNLSLIPSLGSDLDSSDEEMDEADIEGIALKRAYATEIIDLTWDF